MVATSRLRSQRHPKGAHHVGGPLSFLNPTKAYVDAGGRRHSTESVAGDAKPENGGDAPADNKTVAAPGVYHLWRSRDNRKGRHAVVLSPDRSADKHGAVSHPGATDSLKQVLLGVWRMIVRYPIWDVSYDVATMFTLGSVVWVMNGFFVWLPVQLPWTEFNGEEDSGGGITAFIGATIFEFGSVLLMFEAVNENRTQCFGWALEEALESRGSLRLRQVPDSCSHHHPQKRSLISSQNGKNENDRLWQWWPTWQELTTHYFREIGFLACFSQFVGASVFWISGLTALPPIYDLLTVPVANGIYWLPQVVGGTGFIISSWLFMLETQSTWYKPALNTLGWHIGFWNLIGALGFTLCGALGFASENESAVYASVLATFIGSWAFLIGSVIQWYESLDKYPITVQQGGWDEDGGQDEKA